VAGEAEADADAEVVAAWSLCEGAAEARGLW